MELTESDTKIKSHFAEIEYVDDYSISCECITYMEILIPM